MRAMRRRPDGIAQPVRGEADRRRRQHHERKRDGEEEESDKGSGRNDDREPRLQGPAADPQHRLDDDGEHGRLEAEEQPGDNADIAPDHVNPAERHQRDHAGHHEQSARDQSRRACGASASRYRSRAAAPRARVTDAIVQRVQEPRLRDPALLLDQDAVHDRDLAGRAAKAQERHPRARPGRPRAS